MATPHQEGEWLTQLRHVPGILLSCPRNSAVPGIALSPELPLSPELLSPELPGIGVGRRLAGIGEPVWMAAVPFSLLFIDSLGVESLDKLGRGITDGHPRRF